jgi:hypothetical protein
MESGFSRWLRSQPELDSAEGTVALDLDFIIHRYCIRTGANRDRSVQYLMFVEVKSNGADLTPSQRDTLVKVNEIIRTKTYRTSKRKQGRFTGIEEVTTVWFRENGRRVQLICYGVHKLIMSAFDPVTSGWMTWDNKPIDHASLLGVLKFDLNPDTLKPMEHRSRKKRTIAPTLFN